MSCVTLISTGVRCLYVCNHHALCLGMCAGSVAGDRPRRAAAVEGVRRAVGAVSAKDPDDGKGLPQSHAAHCLT